jgi:hypothetical protein
LNLFEPVNALDLPAVQRHVLDALKNNSGALHAMEHATAIDAQPHSDVNGVARLAHQHGITVETIVRVGNGRPTLALWMRLKTLENGAQVGGIYRNLRQLPAKARTLDMQKQAPAVELMGPPAAGYPRSSDVIAEQVRVTHLFSIHRVSPGNSLAV